MFPFSVTLGVSSLVIHMSAAFFNTTFTQRGKILGIMAVLLSVFAIGAIMLGFEARQKPKDRDGLVIFRGYLLCGLSLVVLFMMVICSYVA